MKQKLLQVLGCPKCHSALELTQRELAGDGEIKSGLLQCCECDISWPVVEGIPRFVQSDNYASSFGYQWNQFKNEQVDSLSGLKMSENRLYGETEWSPAWAEGKWILDAGSGAGRFLDVASRDKCEMVGVDISNAVDAAAVTLKGRTNVHLIQASIFELPFRDSAFDACYSLGVIQHTPDPERALRALPRILKAGGKLAVTIYERKKYTMFYSKYLIRSLTRRLNQKFLLNIIKLVMPILWPLTEVLFRVPVLNRWFCFLIPIANYVEVPELSWKQRYQWAVLDTFDMLAPQYDLPQKEDDVVDILSNSGIQQIRRLRSPGLNVVGERAE
jgi:SAM-dependent methyltransferase